MPETPESSERLERGELVTRHLLDGPEETPDLPEPRNRPLESSESPQTSEPSIAASESHIPTGYGAASNAVATIEERPSDLLPASQAVVPPLVEYVDPRDYVRWPRRSGPLRRFLIVAVVLLVVGVYGAGKVDTWVADQIEPTVAVGPQVEFLISDGEGTNTTAQNLTSADVISNSTIFRYWLRCPSTAKRLLNCDEEQEVAWQAGKYLLNTDMAFQTVVDTLNAGSIPPEDFSVTVPEGLTVDQIVDRLVAENPEFRREDFHLQLDRQRFESRFIGIDMLTRLKADGFRTPFEGLLFPSTYQVSEDNAGNELSILQTMAREMEIRYEAAFASTGAALPDAAGELLLSDYDIIIIASLIEEEALVDGDRPKIARVIYNRLLSGSSLGIDATTRYAVEKRPGEPLLQSDLDDPSPYNTRFVENVGLPPTPISAPGQKSIEAALSPEEGDWFFYVLTDEGGVAGAHTFATTNAEFSAAKAICQEKGYC
ncbi:MAG: endolytic transglycosylase MltG [Acidimicrobiales bacterium]